MLDVHYSTDAWIGLAAGRDILSQPTFPKADTWTYTFAGKTWVNQNWLSHVFFWWLYEHLGPNAVAVGTWVIDLAIFALVLVATRLRCRSWVPALLGAGLVAMAMRDWLSPRPATIQLLLLALLWLSLSALLGVSNKSPSLLGRGQGEGLNRGPQDPLLATASRLWRPALPLGGGGTAIRRWWPILLLVPVFLAWPHAHGSFIFAYAALGGFLVSAVIPALFRRPAAITRAQSAAIVGIAAVTAVLAVVLSPYGVENLRHPFVVAESGVFRQVNEWLPPTVSAAFPPVGFFWALLAVTVTCLVAVLILRTTQHGSNPNVDSQPPRATTSGWQPFLFDLGTVTVGLAMALSARRFIAIFYVLATPAVVTWLVRLGRSLTAERRHRALARLAVVSWPAAVLVAWLATSRVQNDLAKFPADQHYNLLQRVTRADQSPLDATEFFRNNALKASLFTQWGLAGGVLFAAPGVRVFIDGRAQQLFSEQHVEGYQSVLAFTETQQPTVLKTLENSGTDAVLISTGTSDLKQLQTALDHSPVWFRALDTPRSLLFLRRGTAFVEDLARRERAGELWWPDTPETMVGRGRLLILSKAPDPSRAVDLWQAAVARRPELGLACYGTITSVLVQQGRESEARAYLQQQRAKVSNPATTLGERARSRLLAEIDRSERSLARPADPVAPASRR